MKRSTSKLIASFCSLAAVSGGLLSAQERLPFVLPVQAPATGTIRVPVPPVENKAEAAGSQKMTKSRPPAAQKRATSAMSGMTTGPSDLKFDEALQSLRGELESLRSMRQESPGNDESVDVTNALATVRQRRMLLDLLQRLATAGPKKSERRAQESKAQDDEAESGMLRLPNLVGGDTVDDFSLGQSLFRAGEHAQAEQAFRSVQYDGTNEWQMKYLIATCLRKQNNTEEAIAMYQEVALSSEDAILIESARWQLQNIRWRQNMEAQLKRLRDARNPGGGGDTDSGDEEAAGPGPAVPEPAPIEGI